MGVNTIRSLAWARTTGRRFVITIAMVVAVIAGLLAMHTVSGAVHTPASSMQTTAGAEHCPGECDEPAHRPDHSMVMTACVLALLAAVTIVFAPALHTRAATPMARAAQLLGTVRALPRPRPPSLLVLSISRT